jgi:hypothetical protein
MLFSEAELILPGALFNKLVEAISHDPLSIVSYDHSGGTGRYRTTHVLYPEMETRIDLDSGNIVPMRHGLAQGINGSFWVDDTYTLRDRDNTRLSDCLSHRINDITQEKAQLITSFLRDRSEQWIDGEHCGDQVRQILRQGSRITIDNRFGNLHLPLDPQLLLRLDCPHAERTGLTGLLGAVKNSNSIFGRTTCVVTDGTFYLISTAVRRPEQSTFMVAIPEPRLTLPSLGWLRVLNPFNCLAFGERLKPLVCIQGKEAATIHFMMEQTCSDQHFKVTELDQSESL